MFNKLIMLSSDPEKNSSSENYYFTFKEIFERKDVHLPFHYLITEYQRPYDWGNMQIRTLIDDIKKLSEDKVHYFGVMYLGNDVSVGNDELSPIMDGQQRFITILLILQALKYSEKLPTIYLYDTYKKNTIMLFPEFEKDFDNLGKEYKKKINENKRIIEKEISSLSDEVKCNLISRILNNLNMIVVKCKDSAIETEIFQNLNAKGKKLDEIDNIKTHILAEHVKLGLEFRENWSKINKKGKSSIKKFLSSLQKQLYVNLPISSSPKYEKFIKICGKELVDPFNETVEKFDWQELDEKDMFDNKTKNNQNWKNYQAACWFAKKMSWNKKMEGELINNFTEYENDSKSALILFLLFYLTFVVDANFRFTSENQYLIDDFIKMNLISRKDKIKELFGKFKNGAIEQIKYSTDSKNKSRDKCLYPLLFFTAILDGNFNYLWQLLVEHKNIHRDHYIPKKLKNTYHNSDYPTYIETHINDFYNLRPLSEALNRNKSNLMPNEFVNDKSINYDKIKEYWNRKKEEMINNFEKVIDKLTK